MKLKVYLPEYIMYEGITGGDGDENETVFYDELHNKEYEIIDNHLTIYDNADCIKNIHDELDISFWEIIEDDTKDV